MARSHDTISYKPKYFSTENETLTKFLDTNNNLENIENIENTKLFRTHIKTALPELDVQNIQQLLSNLSNITINSNSSALIYINNFNIAKVIEYHNLNNFTATTKKLKLGNLLTVLDGILNKIRNDDNDFIEKFNQNKALYIKLLDKIKIILTSNGQSTPNTDAEIEFIIPQFPDISKKSKLEYWQELTDGNRSKVYLYSVKNNYKNITN